MQITRFFNLFRYRIAIEFKLQVQQLLQTSSAGERTLGPASASLQGPVLLLAAGKFPRLVSSVAYKTRRSAIFSICT
jgi:hypothetical protein